MPGLSASLGAVRPLLVAEYPYYRTRAEHWEGNIAALQAEGIDVVSFYLPWRFHEVAHEPAPRYDFAGATRPQTDVRRLLGLIQDHGMKALLKPGPFIHAEVQLGGLPDRVCRRDECAPLVGLDGRPLTSQGRPLPSFFDARMRQQAAGWLRAVADDVVADRLVPAGAVAGIQVGNEGIYSDAALSVDRHDASAPALQALGDWLIRTGRAHLRMDVQHHGRDWGPAEWAVWGEWVGASLREHLLWIAGFFPRSLPTLVNLPLVRLDAPGNAAAGWLVRQCALQDSAFVLGHTEWAGNAARDRAVLIAHVVEVLLARTDALEANWGFTWTDETFADPGVPLFHALLGLMLGSTSSSVYVGCAGSTWSGEIDLDPEGLRREGLAPDGYGPPYCPGAPLNEDGSANQNLKALQRLRAFLRKSGPALLASTLTIQPQIPRPGRTAVDVRPDAERNPLSVVADRAETLLFGTARTAVLCREGDAGNVFVGVFNPGAEPEHVRVENGRGRETIDLPPHGAAVLHYVDGALTASIFT